MIEIKHGKASEYCEILDFLDFVFSKNSRPHDFETMYPNLYLPTDESMGNQICLREDGVIKACLLSYPRTMSVNGNKLKINGIGNVACHPRERGRGFMTKLLTYNNEQMRLDGIHASDLGGRRLRYNRFGYDDGAISYNAVIPRSAVAAIYPHADKLGFELRELKRGDTQLIEKVKNIYESKPIHCEYDYDSFFLRFTIPFSSTECYAVFRDKKLLGHIATYCEDSQCIRELCLSDDNDMTDVLLYYSAVKNADLDVSFGEWQLKYVRPVLELAHNIHVRGSHMWQIIDWKAILLTMLNFKATYSSLPDGVLVLDIDGFGRLAVESQNGVFTVEQTSVPADVILSKLTAVTALTGCAPEIYVNAMELSPKVSLLFRSWFPIPLKMFDTERV